MSIFVPYKEYLILHGGFAKSSPNPIHQAANFFNEIHMYDTKTNEWIEVIRIYSYGKYQSVKCCFHCGTFIGLLLKILSCFIFHEAVSYLLNHISKIWTFKASRIFPRHIILDIIPVFSSDRDETSIPCNCKSLCMCGR